MRLKYLAVVILVFYLGYDFYDKDPDGVREAYDCMYDSVHTYTLTTEKFDSEKLHLYMFKTDNTAFKYVQESDCQDAIQINLQDVKAVFVFLNSKEPLLDNLVNVANKIISKNPTYNEAHNIINTTLKSDKEDYLALFKL